MDTWTYKHTNTLVNIIQCTMKNELKVSTQSGIIGVNDDRTHEHTRKLVIKLSNTHTHTCTHATHTCTSHECCHSLRLNKSTGDHIDTKSE